MNLEQLYARRTAILDRQDAIGKDAGDKGLTAEQRTEFDSLDTEFEDVNTKIKGIEEDQARIAKLATRRTEASRVPTKTAGSGLSSPPNDKKTDVRVVGEGFEKDPKCGFENHRDFFLQVMEAPNSRLATDPRMKFMAAGADEQSTVNDAYGGYLIPHGLAPGVLMIGGEGDLLGKYITQIPMQSPTLPFNARVDKNHSTSVSGGFRVYRRAETQTVTASRAEYEQVVLTATALMGVAFATEEVLERSPISFVSLIEQGFGDEFPARLMQERLTGTGVGQFEGILNSAAKIEVAKEASQAANTIVFENVIKMSARCWGRGNAVWIANHNTRPQLRSLWQDFGGGGIAQPLFTIENGVERLDGRPILFTEYAETLGTAGDLILFNPTQYLEGVLSSRRSAESMHVRFLEHERTFKFWMENDGRLSWKTALTPNKGSTLSPVVTLQTRA